MNDVPVQLIVAAFTEENGADRALDELKRAKKENLIGIRDAAVIRRDASDKLHIKEIGDMSGGKGAGAGAIVGGAIGIIFPPSLLAAGAVGAAIGGLAAKLHDAGFPDERLKEIGAALKPGTSAIVAVIEHQWVAELEQELATQGARIVEESIKEDIAQQLAAGHSVGYTAIAYEDAVVTGRMVEEPGSHATSSEPAVPAASTTPPNPTEADTASPPS